MMETINTNVTGALWIIRQNSPAFGPHGQYLLRIIFPENGIVKARARSAAARSNINRFRGVRTYYIEMKIILIFRKQKSLLILQKKMLKIYLLVSNDCPHYQRVGKYSDHANEYIDG